jgi:hypothetical protein
MSFSDRKVGWTNYADKLVAVSYEMVVQCDNLNTTDGIKSPKIVALTLLCRSLCHFKSIFRLLDAGLIIDARTLARCIFENLFWLGRLAEDGLKFVQEAIQDHAKSRQSRGNWILDWMAQQGNEPPYKDGLQETVDQLRAKFPKPQSINLARITQGSVLKAAYLWYKQLSSDAAHPSLESLQRHITKNPDGSYLISVEPEPKDKELVDTMEYACQALLGVIVAANQIVGPTKAGERLIPLADEFNGLAAADKKVR